MSYRQQGINHIEACLILQVFRKYDLSNGASRLEVFLRSYCTYRTTKLELSGAPLYVRMLEQVRICQGTRPQSLILSVPVLIPTSAQLKYACVDIVKSYYSTISESLRKSNGLIRPKRKWTINNPLRIRLIQRRNAIELK